MQGRARSRRRWPLALALLCGGLAALPLFLNPGFLNTRAGGDSPFLFFRLHQLYTALSEGVFPVRWMPDAAYGLGYPFFNYYAALAYYFAAGLKAFGFSYVAALKLTHLAGFLLAAWATYGRVLASHGGAGRARALLASAAYTFGPYHLVNVYVRGDSLTEFWAFALYPLIFWVALRLREKPSLKRAVALGLAYAALILDHNISALIFTPFFLLYLLFIAYRPHVTCHVSRVTGQFLRFTFYAFISLALALALSAFYWVPALGETGYVQLGEQTSGYFHYNNHFREIPYLPEIVPDPDGSDSLVQTTLLFEYDIRPEKLGPFSMGLVQAILLVAALLGIAILRARTRLLAPPAPTRSGSPNQDPAVGGPRQSRGVGFLLTGLALSTFMILPASEFLWANLPLLPLVQFPWRFLSVQALFASVLIADGLTRIAYRLSRTSKHTSRQVDKYTGTQGHLSTCLPVYLSANLLLVILLALAALARLPTDFIQVTDGDMTPQRLQLYEYFTGNIGTTIRAEYLPEAVVPRPYTSDEFLGREPRLKVLSGEAEGKRLEKRAGSNTWRITAFRLSTVAVPLLYFPGWRAMLDGQPLPVSAAPGLGYVQFELPPGEHTVRLDFGRTPLRAAAETVSLLAFLGVLVGALHSRLISDVSLATRQTSNIKRHGLRLALYGLCIAVLFGLSAVLRRGNAAPGHGLTADFEQQAFHRSAPVTFEDGTQLEGYRYEKDRLRPGEPLNVRFEFAGAPVSTLGSLRLVTPAAIYLGASEAAGSQDFTLGPEVSAQIRLPPDLPPGVYLPELHLNGAGPFTASDEPRGTLYLAPVYVDALASESTPSLIAFGPDIELVSAQTKELEPGLLEVNLGWRAVNGVPQNYALALRLHDAAGNEWYAVDTQPAFGFYPTGMWRPGEVIPDSFDLYLPQGLPPSAGYKLIVTLYDASSLEAVGSFLLPTTLSLPAPLSDRQARFLPIPELGLEGVDLPAQILQGESFSLDARWLAFEPPTENYLARWTLSGPVKYVVDSELAPASAPRSWPARSFILGRAHIPVPPDFLPGSYTLSLQLMAGPESPVGESLRVGTVDVIARPRVFEPPPVTVEMGTTFGGLIKLWGYDLSREENRLTLTVQWGAVARLEEDFAFFLHLAALDQRPVRQVDGMPRGYTYPTSQWLPGEVVSDTLTLDLTGVPPGTYHLALGWYDLAALDRLPALDANGLPLEGDRVVLPDAITTR